MSNYSYISNAHPAYIDALYKNYQADTNSVDEGWRKFFEGFDFAFSKSNQNGSAAQNTAGAGSLPDGAKQSLSLELNVYRLINDYRNKAHLLSDTNPIRPRRDRHPHLDLDDFGFTDAELEKRFALGAEIGLPNAKLSEIIKRLQTIYTGTIGLEYGYVTDPNKRKWIQERFEGRTGEYNFDIKQKKRILRKLNEAVVFEEFLHKKFIGQKRFSLEGGESTIPALDAIIQKSAELGTKEVVIGMAHRGRLNALVNILGKTYDEVFNSFQGHETPLDLTMGDGDVKYHLGFSSMLPVNGGDKSLYVQMMPNPSHLEAVNPVVLGYVRAKADAIYKSDYDSILPILVHGDSAIAGQGIVYEVTQMEKLEGYETGGTIHFIINNQIGFTTNFDDARSADYCTAVSAMIKAPVLHVNGDDVEAVVFASEFAAEYRATFNSDILVDMVCYRRHGHNEADDPQFTQPELYKLIRNHPDPRDIYSEKLSEAGEVEAELVKKMYKEFWDFLQDRLNEVKQNPLPYKPQKPELAWRALRKSTPEDFEQSPITGISKRTANIIVEGLSTTPEGFKPLSKVLRMLEKRRKTMQENKSLDWAAAELMAYASILMEGKNVRMSGQDVKRGTFSHRHAILHDEETYENYSRLQNFSENQGRFLIYNSLLSEYAVLGFEFGYSLASPDALAIWEAQFGDFANGAQIMIDQFIVSSESKWQRTSGLVMLLPHGYEGQGPEHSSARLERFLQACAQKNICVLNLTEPANFFHALRRQMHRPFRQPLIVMSPKSLLRHPKCSSDIMGIIDNTRFWEVIDDTFITKPKSVKRVLLCSGKIYYDLAERREERNKQDVAIIRIEQLYPLARKQLNEFLSKYPNAEIVWVQEEPANMGAWWHILYRLGREYNIRYIGRKASASPATGFYGVHRQEQAAIINEAFKF